jgi:hypothetical protein
MPLAGMAVAAGEAATRGAAAVDPLIVPGIRVMVVMMEIILPEDPPLVRILPMSAVPILSAITATAGRGAGVITETGSGPILAGALTIGVLTERSGMPAGTGQARWFPVLGKAWACNGGPRRF